MDEEDVLYELPLADFTAARKALAKRHREAGDRESAKRVEGLAKPTVAAWTLNQLVRHDRPLVTAVLAAIDRQRDLQLGALTGGLDSEALARAKAAERTALHALIGRAQEVLRDGGQTPSKANLDRLARALRAVALDAAQRERLEAGRLSEEAAEGGLEAIAAQLDPALLLAALEAEQGKRKSKKPPVDSFLARSVRGDRGAKPESRVAPRIDAAEIAKTRARVAALRSELEEGERAVKAASDRVADLERDLEAARLEQRGARRKLRELRERLDAAEKRLRLLTQ
jgi:hypothetical protein